MSSLLLDPNNIHAILSKLEDQFGSIELVYSSLLQEVLAIRNPRFEVPKSMVDFISNIGNMVTNMKCLNHEEYLNDQRLIRDLSCKLPDGIHQKWLMYVHDKKMASTLADPFVAPTLSDFYEWLKPQEKLAMMLIAEKGTRNEKFSRNDKFDKLNYHGNTQKFNCLLCGRDHKMLKCDKYRKMSVVERRKYVGENGLCFGCCEKGHRIDNCIKTDVCNIDGCQNKHYRTLHPIFANAVAPVKVNRHMQNQRSVYYQILLVTLINVNR